MSYPTISALATSLEDFEKPDGPPRNSDHTFAPYTLNSLQIGSLVLLLFQARQLEEENELLKSHLSAWKEVAVKQQIEIEQLAKGSRVAAN